MFVCLFQTYCLAMEKARVPSRASSLAADSGPRQGRFGKEQKKDESCRLVVALTNYIDCSRRAKRMKQKDVRNAHFHSTDKG